MEKIGVLGGSGAVSTAFLYNRILEICVEQYNACSDHKFPYLIIYNSPLQNLNEKGENPQNFLPTLVKQIKEMESIGCTTIVMACNTLHEYFNTIKSLLKPQTNLISMLDITLEALNKLNTSNISVLCSEKSASIKLHNNAWEKSNINIYYSDIYEQTKINCLIDDVIKLKHNRQSESELMNILRQNSLNDILPTNRVIVVSCTELSVIYNRFKNIPFNQPVLDTCELLAQYIAKISYQ